MYDSRLIYKKSMFDTDIDAIIRTFTRLILSSLCLLPNPYSNRLILVPVWQATYRKTTTGSPKVI